MKKFDIVIRKGKASVYTPYNAEYVDRIKKLGGRWNAGDRCWKVPADIVEDVRQMMRDIYGRDDRGYITEASENLRHYIDTEQPEFPLSVRLENAYKAILAGVWFAFVDHEVEEVLEKCVVKTVKTAGGWCTVCDDEENAGT